MNGNPKLNDEVNASKFPLQYAKLGLDTRGLGCVMVKLEKSPLLDCVGDPGDYYVAKDAKLKWVNGWVADKKPHVTLRYGFLKKFDDAGYKALAEKALEGWEAPDVEVDKVAYFEGTQKGESYTCIVAKIRTEGTGLMEGYLRLGLVPNVATFPVYTPHLTICYFPKSKGEAERDALVRLLDKKLAGKKFGSAGLDWGTDPI